MSNPSSSTATQCLFSTMQAATVETSGSRNHPIRVISSARLRRPNTLPSNPSVSQFFNYWAVFSGWVGSSVTRLGDFLKFPVTKFCLRIDKNSLRLLGDRRYPKSQKFQLRFALFECRKSNKSNIWITFRIWCQKSALFRVWCLNRWSNETCSEIGFKIWRNRGRRIGHLDDRKHEAERGEEGPVGVAPIQGRAKNIRVAFGEAKTGFQFSFAPWTVPEGGETNHQRRKSDRKNERACWTNKVVATQVSL